MKTLQEFVTDGIKNYYSVDTEKNEATLWHSDCHKGILTIPDKVGGYKVTRIENGSFVGDKFEECVVGANIREIGMCAFHKCKKLKKLTFLTREEEEIPHICEMAFKFCDKLNMIEFPALKAVNKIVHDMNEWEEVVFLSHFMRNVDYGAFSGCYKMPMFLRAH